MGSTDDRAGDALYGIPKHCDRCRTIGHCMVDLHHDRDAFAGQALEDKELPERPIPKQRLACERGHRIGELLIATGIRKHHPGEVAPQLELRVLHPDGMVQAPGHRDDPSAKSWEPNEKVPEDFGKVVVGEPDYGQPIRPTPPP